MEGLLYGFAVEELVADLQDTVGVRLAFNQSSQKLILPFQILSLQEVNP